MNNLNYEMCFKDCNLWQEVTNFKKATQCATYNNSGIRKKSLLSNLLHNRVAQ